MNDTSRRASGHRLTLADQADRHRLYQEAVQDPESAIEFMLDTFRTLRNRQPLHLREDFCGTAFLAAEWVKGDPERQAVGVDLCGETLRWGRRNNIDTGGKAVAQRVQLIQADVRDVDQPVVDIACAFNFSYLRFESRDHLRDYFETVHRSLQPDGLFFLDLLGGTETPQASEEETELDDGTIYIWDQISFNPIDHHMECRIHFRFTDGSHMDNAFTYAWRLWSMPEILELLEEAGFNKTRVYWERFEEDDDDDEYLAGTGEYEEVTDVENQESWISYIVAER